MKRILKFSKMIPIFLILQIIGHSANCQIYVPKGCTLIKISDGKDRILKENDLVLLSVQIKLNENADWFDRSYSEVVDLNFLSNKFGIENRMFIGFSLYDVLELTCQRENQLILPKSQKGYISKMKISLNDWMQNEGEEYPEDYSNDTDDTLDYLDESDYTNDLSEESDTLSAGMQKLIVSTYEDIIATSDDKMKIVHSQEDIDAVFSKMSEYIYSPEPKRMDGSVKIRNGIIYKVEKVGIGPKYQNMQQVFYKRLCADPEGNVIDESLSRELIISIPLSPNNMLIGEYEVFSKMNAGSIFFTFLDAENSSNTWYKSKTDTVCYFETFFK